MRTRSALTALLLAALATLFAAPAVRAQDEDPIETIAAVPAKGRLALVKAAEARKTGEYGRAVAILQDIVENHPRLDHYLVRFSLGSSLALAGRDADAVPQFRAAVEMEPRHADSWLGLGQAAYAAEAYAVAGEALEQGYRRGSDPQVDILYYAGASWLMAKRPDEAARILTELTSGRHGRPKLDWFRALVAAAVDKEDRALGDRAVADMLKVYPDSPEAWQLAFQHAAANDDLRRAAVSLTVKSFLTTLSETELIQLGDLYRVIDVPVKAADFYTSALGEEPAPEDYERLASAYLAAHDGDEAERVLTDALARSPSLRLWALLGDLKYMEEDYAGAYRAYDACRELDADYGRVWLMMGYCAMELENLADARRHLEQAASYEDQADSARNLLSQVARLEARAAED